MPTLVRDLPYFAHATKVKVGRHSFPVKSEQIIVWISVAAQGSTQFDPRTPRFPAILDTGCNHNLLINQQHLTVYAGLPSSFCAEARRDARVG